MSSTPNSTDHTLPTSPSETSQDAAVSRQLMLTEARNNLSVGDSFIPEIECFLKAIEARVKIPRLTGLPALIRKLKRELAIIQHVEAELAESQPDDDALNLLSRKLVASATIIQHGAAHWDILKRCNSFVVTGQTFQGSAKEDRKREVSQAARQGKEKQLLHRTLKEQSKVDVDVINGGSEWLDIRWLQADRLARQMTDNGWGWGEYELGDVVDPDEWEDTQLAKQVKRLMAAARINRHEYRIPRVRIVFPNLDRGDDPDINVFLDQLKRLDPSIEVLIEDSGSAFMQTPPPVLDTAIQNLLGNELDGLTDTLNMDHTILVDLISDITHFELQPQPWQAQTTRMQIEEEKKHGGLMVQILYPLLTGRKLVCTQEAAEHFHEVLSTVGTATEKARGMLLVPFDDETRSMAPSEIRKRFEELSIHALPPSVQIPIHILCETWTLDTAKQAVADGRLPKVALDVAKCGGFKSSKLSIYMYGWATGNVTLSSNKEVRGQIRTWVETNRHDDAECGPPIWRVDVTRNLLAKSATPPGVDTNGKVEDDTVNRRR